MHRQRVLDGDLVVALDDHLFAKLSEIMEKIVGETIVIIDQKQRMAPRCLWISLAGTGPHFQRLFSPKPCRNVSPSFSAQSQSLKGESNSGA